MQTSSYILLISVILLLPSYILIAGQPFDIRRPNNLDVNQGAEITQASSSKPAVLPLGMWFRIHSVRGVMLTNAHGHRQCSESIQPEPFHVHTT